jgi:heptose II phosphotransferase
MLRELQRDGAWVCFVDNNDQYQLPSIPELLKTIDGFDVTLKDDRRSLVKKGELGDCMMVAKQPRDKNRRVWARFLSLFRYSEAKKTFLTLKQFKEKGIESVFPVCVMEKREFGGVVDSWLLYEYREGCPCGIRSLEAVIDQLKNLHRNGYRHEDPNFGNVRLDAKGDLFLIDCKGKSRAGRFGEYYDYMLVSHRNDGVEMNDIEELVTMSKHSLGYWLASTYAAYKTARTALKKRLKRQRSKKDFC